MFDIFIILMFSYVFGRIMRIDVEMDIDVKMGIISFLHQVVRCAIDLSLKVAV